MTPGADGPLTLAAPAKVNLFLEVLGKRPDGYHEVVTLLVPLAGLDDTLTFAAADGGEVRLDCDDPALTTGPENLVLRAAAALRRHAGHAGGAHIRLAKRIPAAAGLGGGSSDAAATLAGLDRLWGLGLSREELMRVAAAIGSDVPFFLAGGTPAWCTGRGERVAPTAAATELDLLLLCPGAGLSTAAVYGGVTVPPAPRDPGPMTAALAAGDPAAVAAALFNRLQEPAERLLPAVAAVRGLLDELLPAGLHWGHLMSGSGSSVLAVCRGEGEARRLGQTVSERWRTVDGGRGLRAFVVKGRGGGPAGA